MGFLRNQNAIGRTDHRRMKRIDAEAQLVITTLVGEVHVGVLLNMNTEAIAAYVQTDLEPGNRVSVSYHTNGFEEQVEIHAIVRRRSGFCYVFDSSLVDEFDQHWPC